MFSFTDRGTDVLLNTTFQFEAPLTPTHFKIKGDTARLSKIDEEVAQVPAGTFTLAGYAPVSMQMELLRYWTSHGRPASIPLLPQGAARIEPRGRDTISTGGKMRVTRSLQRQRRPLGTRDAVDRRGRHARRWS